MVVAIQVPFGWYRARRLLALFRARLDLEVGVGLRGVRHSPMRSPTVGGNGDQQGAWWGQVRLEGTLAG